MSHSPSPTGRSGSTRVEPAKGCVITCVIGPIVTRPSSADNVAL